MVSDSTSDSYDETAVTAPKGLQLSADIDADYLQSSKSITTPYHIPFVLDSLSGDKYRVTRKIGRSIYVGICKSGAGEGGGSDEEDGDNEGDSDDKKDVDDGGEVAIKFEAINHECPRLENEAQVYDSLAGGIGIPFMHYFGTTEYSKYMVFDLLGPNLDDLFKFCERKFTLKTVLLVADQLISRIEYIHSLSWIHRNINAENFIIGTGKFSNQIYITNFRLAEHYNPKAKYLDSKPSYRDDLESLGYMMLYFLGSRTWEELKTISIQDLCQGLPQEFAIYFNYTRNLHFDEKPDYSYLKKLFDNLFIRMRFQKDCIFDWTIRKYQRLTQQNTQAVVEPISPQSTISPNFVPTSKETSVSEGISDTTIDLKTRPISQDQLVAEVDSIYAGLLMVESKCVEMGKSTRPNFSNKQYQALLNLYRYLLNEHYDLHLVSQHPTADSSLREVPSKLGLPYRIWDHGICAHLKLLIDRLPGSRNHLLSFFRLAYSMMALLFETVPNFKTEWIECLYHLAHFRAIIENSNTRDREIWGNIRCYWDSQRHHSEMIFPHYFVSRQSIDTGNDSGNNSDTNRIYSAFLENLSAHPTGREYVGIAATTSGSSAVESTKGTSLVHRGTNKHR